MEAARLVKTRQHSAAPLAPATDLEEGRSPPIAAAPPSWRPGIAATRDSVVGQSPPASAQPSYFAQASLQLLPPLAPYHGSALPVLPAHPSPRQPPPAVNAGDEVDYALYLAEARGVPPSCLTSFLGAAEARGGDSSPPRARSEGPWGYAGTDASSRSRDERRLGDHRDEQAAVSGACRPH